MIKLELEKSDASVLAQFCARAFLERIEPFAEGAKEADLMLGALARLGLKLEQAGFAVR